MKREIVIRVDKDELVSTYVVETDMDAETLKDAASAVQDEFEDLNEPWSEDDIIETLQERNYLRVVKKPGPEVVDLDSIF